MGDLEKFLNRATFIEGAGGWYELVSTKMFRCPYKGCREEMTQQAITAMPWNDLVAKMNQHFREAHYLGDF